VSQPTDSESTATLVIKWASLYGSLQAVTYDSLDEAIKDAFLEVTLGDEFLQGFEVWDAAGYRFISEVAARELIGLQRLKVVAHVRLEAPNGKRIGSSRHTSIDEAQREVDRLKPFLGERVWLEMA